jgi:hypothetical protein
MRPGVILLTASVCLAAQAPDPPDDRAILDAGRENALAFTGTLPDFICTQSVRRFQGPAGSNSWRQTDRLAVQLSYSGLQENYQLVSIDDHPADQPFHAVGGAVSHGEFGSWLQSVFDPASAAEFQPEGRATVSQRAAAVFSYKVGRDHSHYDLNYREGPGRVASATVGYHGRVYIDLDSNRVTRLEIEADEIPKTFPLRRSSIALHYDFIEIASRMHLVPISAETRVATAKLAYRNEIEFSGYRKFEGTSAVHFGEGGDTSNESTNAPSSTEPAKELTRLRDDKPIFPAPVLPSAEERDAALEEARRAAADYLASLPAFVCSDRFRIFIAPPGESWKSRGVVTGELRHSAGGAQHFQPGKLDEDASTNRTEFEQALPTEGSWNVEFGKLRNNILDPRSAAQFTWDHWSSLLGRMTHVYSFIVPVGDSHYVLTARETDSLLPPLSAPVALRGFLFIDRDSHRVTRIYSEAVAIPPALGVRNASTQLDFSFAGLGGVQTLLPRRATFRVDLQSHAARYESEIRSCVKP